VVNRYAYDPSGTMTSSAGTAVNPWRFGDAYGAYTDTAAGLVKIGQRYYGPGFGRWTQRDPLGAGNPYTYTNCNPVNGTDSSGLISLACIGALATAGVALVALASLIIRVASQ